MLSGGSRLGELPEWMPAPLSRLNWVAEFAALLNRCHSDSVWMKTLYLKHNSRRNQLKELLRKKSSSIKHFESGRGQIWSSCSLKVDVELLEHFWQILQNGNNLFLYFSTTKKKSCNLFILELVVQHSHHGCKWRENKRKKEREKNIQTCHNQLQRFFRWAIWVLIIMRGKSKPKKKKGKIAHTCLSAPVRGRRRWG